MYVDAAQPGISSRSTSVWAVSSMMTNISEVRWLSILELVCQRLGRAVSSDPSPASRLKMTQTKLHPEAEIQEVRQKSTNREYCYCKVSSQ
jgi:hypothetical protein